MKQLTNLQLSSTINLLLKYIEGVEPTQEDETIVQDVVKSFRTRINYNNSRRQQENQTILKTKPKKEQQKELIWYYIDDEGKEKRYYMRADLTKGVNGDYIIPTNPLTDTIRPVNPETLEYIPLNPEDFIKTEDYYQALGTEIKTPIYNDDYENLEPGA